MTSKATQRFAKTHRMPDDELTDLQEMFCHVAVTERNKSDAYRKVYNATKMNPSSINREASRLMHNPKITTRIRELQADLASRMDWDRNRLVDVQGSIFQAAYVAGSWGQATAALREIAKLVGAYEQPDGLPDINIFGVEGYDFSEFEPTEISAIIRFIRMVVGARRESEASAVGSAGSSSGVHELGTGTPAS